jgi:hypothetical protein
MNKCLERVNDRHFGILESSATQWYQDVPHNSRVFFFFIVTSIVYALKRGFETVKILNQVVESQGLTSS